MKSDWVSASFRKLGREAVVTLSSVGASRVDDIWKDATESPVAVRRVNEDVKEHEILQ